MCRDCRFWYQAFQSNYNRAHGPHLSPEKTKYCIFLFIMLIKRRKTHIIYFMRIIIKLESPLPKDALCQFSWNWPSGFGEEDFKFLLFRNYLLLIKGGALHLNQLEISLPKDTLCQVWLKLAKWFWSRYHLPLKRAETFIWTNLNSLHPRMHCVKFGWIVQRFWRGRFLKFHQWIFPIS